MIKAPIKVAQIADAKRPERIHLQDAAFDIYCPCDVVVTSELTDIPLGIIVAIPAGYAGSLRLRSSWLRRGLCMPGTGTIDYGYDGEIHLLCFAPWHDVVIQKNKRIAQLVVHPINTSRPLLVPVHEIKRPPSASRGGFGSTGDD